MPEFIRARRCVVHAGIAYLPESEVASLAAAEFSRVLRDALELTAKAVPRLDESDRLIPLLASMSSQRLAKEYVATGSGVSAGDIKAMSVSFPPCMRHLYDALESTKHLKHTGRLQLGLFLKGVGLGLEEALVFWRRAFSNLGDDAFQKKGYPYNIRYFYSLLRLHFHPLSFVEHTLSADG